MTLSRHAVLAGVAIAAVTSGRPVLAEAHFDRESALAASRAAIGQTLGDHTFRDISGQAFPLSRLAGKPLIVSLVYSSCHHVCPMITTTLAKAVPIARDALGEGSFNVVTIGFDWAHDSPDRMRTYARERGIDEDNWHFLSGDAPTIESVSRNLGFRFYPSVKGFDHLMQTTIVDSGGRVYRQVYGQDFPATAIVEPLKELIFATPPNAGIVEHWVDNLLLFCTVYDPNTGRYRFDYSIFMTIVVGVLCLGAVFFFIVHEWRHAR